ncbi:MAG TPA: hypothetical protein VLR46_05510 [Candidatus Dormibacteraeota bacterium]|nr:hypothetical protein [Candidatus Dormibacteraeota bacterium]
MPPLKLYPDTPGRKTRWIGADVLVVVWLGFWSLLGFYIHQLVEVLQAIPDAIDRAGSAIDVPLQNAMNYASQIPIFGSLIVDRLQAANAATAGRAHAVAAALTNMIDIAALGVALVAAVPPILLVIGFYGSDRWRASREMGSAKRIVEVALREHRGQQLNEALARRAIEVVPYRRLVKVTPDPLGELQAGHYDALAAQSLSAAGLSPILIRPVAGGAAQSLKRGPRRVTPRGP